MLVSPGGTGGWRSNEAELSASLSRLGVAHAVRRAEPTSRRLLRFWPLGSLLVARAARCEVLAALSEGEPGAILMVNSTSALLLPWRRLRRRGVPVAIRIDSPASALWPGASHVLQRRLERRALAAAEVTLATGPASADLARPLARRVVEVPVPVEARRVQPPDQLVGAVAYAGQPRIKGLDRICRAWAELESHGRAPALTITGVDREQGLRFLRRAGAPEPASAVWAGALPREPYLELLARAQILVSASRYEGHGIAQLEALAAGVPVVTTPSPGAYEAEEIARRLAPEFVTGGEEREEPAALAAAVEAAGEIGVDARKAYAERAQALVEPFSPEFADEGMRKALAILDLDPSGARGRA